MPFNAKTPIGYFVAFSVLIVIMVFICHISVCVVCLLVGFFGIMMSFGLNAERKLRRLCEDYTMTGNHVKLRSELRDLILFHSKIKQLSRMLVLFKPLSQKQNLSFQISL